MKDQEQQVFLKLTEDDMTYLLSSIKSNDENVKLQSRLLLKLPQAFEKSKVSTWVDITKREIVQKQIAGAIKATINQHGPITRELTLSFAKRTWFALRNMAMGHGQIERNGTKKIRKRKHRPSNKKPIG